MLNPSLAGQFAALDLSGGGTITGNVVIDGTLRTTNLGVGLAPDTTRIHMLSQASDYAPVSFTADDLTVGKTDLSGASSGAVFMRYNSTASAGMVGALSPGSAWLPLVFGSSQARFVNASSVAKAVMPGVSANTLNVASDTVVGFSSTTDATAAADTTIARSATGLQATTTITNGNGIEGLAVGLGSGVKGTGGPTAGGAGGEFYGGSGGGDGVYAAGTTSNAGVEAIGGPTDGSVGTISTSSATNGNGGRFTGTGTGYGITAISPGGYPVICSGDTTTPVRAALRLIPQDTAPSSPQEGDIYANSGDHKLYFYNGTGWQALF